MAVDYNFAEAAIGSGVAFKFLDRYTWADLELASTDAALQRRLGGPSAVNLETVVHIIVQYELWRQAGAAIERGTNPNTPYVRHLPDIPGCSGNFEYVTVQTFHDPNEGTTFTKPFVISSDVALSKNDILRAAREAALAYLSNDTYLLGSPAGETGTYTTGPARVTAAARCTP